MNKPHHGYYHCLECGTLFEAAVVGIREQRCSLCGNPPTGRILAGTGLDGQVTGVTGSEEKRGVIPTKRSEIDSDKARVPAVSAGTRRGKGKKRVKQRKHRQSKVKKFSILVTVWLVLVGGTAFLVKYLSQDDDSSDSSQMEIQIAEQRQRESMEQKRRERIIQVALPGCAETMTQFLNADSAAAKAQYVYQGKKLSAVMARYYKNNPSFSSTRSSIKIIATELLSFEDKLVIGAVCMNSLEERFETIFIKVGSEWKIDWLSLVRYDSRSWSLFPAGKNGDEGEFRLYMRVRDTNENLEQKYLSVVFYKPDIYAKKEFDGLASSSVRIRIDSKLGQQIKQLMDSEEELENDALGFPVKTYDPPRYHRVRVKLKLLKKPDVPPGIELLDIVENHWYGIDQLEAEELKLDHAP